MVWGERHQAVTGGHVEAAVGRVTWLIVSDVPAEVLP